MDGFGVNDEVFTKHFMKHFTFAEISGNQMESREENELK